MPSGTQTRIIKIKVDAPGVKEALDRISGSMGGIAKNTKSLAGNLSTLKNSLFGFIGALGIRELARMSDEMQNLSNRLKLVTREGTNVREVMGDIERVANETNQSIADVAQIYTRMGTALKAAGASSDSLLALSKSLINSFRLAGSTGTETTATIIQLSQAFASGTLRGQELRSVMLQNATLAGLLRQRFGANLAKDAEAGLISVTEVLKLLRDNMEQINASAKLLTPTFEQTLTKAFNSARIALLDLNTEFDLAGKFAVVVESLTRSIKTLFTALSDMIGYLLDHELFTPLATGALALFVAINPLTGAIVTLSVVLVSLFDSMGDFIDHIRLTLGWIVNLRVELQQLGHDIEVFVARPFWKFGLVSDGAMNRMALQIEQITELRSVAEDLAAPKYTFSLLRADKKGGNEKDAIQDLIDKLEAINKSSSKIEKIKTILGGLNAQFLSGALSVGEYNRKIVDFNLYKLNREFKEGKFDIFEYTERLRVLKEQDLSRLFRDGTLTIQQFNSAVEDLRTQELELKLQGGVIGLKEFDSELVKITQQLAPGSAFRAGVEDFLNGVGTLSSGIAGAISNSFNSLSEEIFNMTKTGKFEFKKFAQSVLDDISRIIIKASIVQPLAQALLSYNPFQASGPTGGSYGTGSYPIPAAKGMAFDGGIKKYASGGIVNSPTMFGYGSGKTGIMGEAGPEAILPLKRGSGGNLGVAATVTPVTVNIINQSGNEVSQKESTGPNGEKTIDILISNKVKEGLISGQYDKAMRQSYGLNRKGS